MPLYEYQCPSCGTFELIQKFSDPALTECPKCQSAVEKLLSAPAFHLKGSGWYITDYARKGQKDGESAKSEAKAESKAESSDSKAETKTEAKPSTPAASSVSTPASA